MKKLDRFLPATQKLSHNALWTFLKKYETVILKPFSGKQGNGVIQVTLLDEGLFLIQNEDRKFIMGGKKATFNQLKLMTCSQNYLVQRRIALAEIEHRPMDIRVMVRRKKQLPWKVTGMVAIVAEDGYIVTNVSRTVLPVDQAIEQSLMKPVPTQKIVQKITNLCLLAAKQIGHYYPSQNKIGFDIGIDHYAKLWIIEANFKPSMQPFVLLKNNRMDQP